MHNKYVPKIGGCALLGEEELGPHLTQCAGAEAYLHAKFHLDPSNRLATVYQRYRQDRQIDRQRTHSIGEPFYKWSPKKLISDFTSEIFLLFTHIHKTSIGLQHFSVFQNTHSIRLVFFCSGSGQSQPTN